MAKTRLTISKATRDVVLSEFNHRCAKCGADNPQIHHIDEDPSNNDPLNLIPLCPNCHLIDQHNPTKRVEPLKLALFKKFKDPFIFKPQFQPFFDRVIFLNSVNDNSDVGDLHRRCDELKDFVACLEMGTFYSKRIDEMLRYPGGFISDWRDPNIWDEENARTAKLYRQQLQTIKDEMFGLLVEMLRFQKW